VTSVEVVMSWRDVGCPHRTQALHWTLQKWMLAGYHVTLSGADDGQSWNRAHDVTPPIERSTAGIVVVADADCWTDGIHDAIAAVEAGAPWAVPHRMLCRLGPEATERVLAGGLPEDQDDFAERPYKGHEAGTMFVIRRDVYLDCPLDPRFVGWGQEDDALSLALRLLHAPPWRGTAPLWHLWHPAQPRKNRGIGSDENLALYRRYRVARHDVGRMRRIVDEAKAVHA
jgi:hypothetical protein